MKLKTEIIALCDYALVDKQGKISIIGIFDEFRAEKFPSGFMDKFLVATINGEPNTPYTLYIQLKRENMEKNLLKPTIVNINMSSNGKHNLIV